MILRIAGFVAVAAGFTLCAQAQVFTPAERQLLMQPSAIGGEPGTFTPSARGEGSKPAKGSARPQVSISSELNRGGAPETAPTLRKPREIGGQTPFDQRVPFGPLSLGLQAETAPRSDSLQTPVPEGMNQFKKDRTEPYVGLSIIDIKR
jgi:hypothetical protein